MKESAAWALGYIARHTKDPLDRGRTPVSLIQLDPIRQTRCPWAHDVRQWLLVVIRGSEDQAKTRDRATWDAGVGPQ